MTLTAFYDLAVGPVSFDFVVFLIKAEMARRKAGAERLHVVIVPDPNGPGGFRDKSQFYDQHEARWRLHNICIPACALLGATVTLAPDWGYARHLGADAVVFPHDWDRQTLKDRRHLVGDIITAARDGIEVPRLSASKHARRNVREFWGRERVVTMTLRRTYLKERNSDAGAWETAAQHIRSKGYYVALLRDVSEALVTGKGYGELNLDIRMAMYQEAELNLQANNGSASLCWFSDVPYVMFGAGIPVEDWDGLFVRQGLPLGESWPWALKGQQLSYRRDTADALIAAFEEHVGRRG